jgi:mRNA interferase RelE/StbE
MDKWRIVYTVSDVDTVIDVLTVRQRPPYDYGDLAELLEQAQ